MTEELKQFLIRQWCREYLRVNGKETTLEFTAGRFQTPPPFSTRLTTVEVTSAIERQQKKPTHESQTKI